MEAERKVVSEAERLQIPKIDLSKADPAIPGGDGWAASRAQVMQALETYGCFEALYDKVTPELRYALFDCAMPELFSLPLETKKCNTAHLPFQAYLGQLPGMAYESLRVNDAPNVEAAEKFTRLIWPQGNPGFRDTICTYAKHMKDLEQMIELMVFQSMGIEKYYESHIESTEYGIRLSDYGVPFDQETKIAMNAHLDPNLVTIICQHQVEGLEVQTREGEWVHVAPSAKSFTVMIGEAFEAFCNGRLRPPHHRVRIISNEKRKSVLFGSRPKDGCLVQAPEELVDEEHPGLYKPYDYDSYLQFRFSEKGARAKNTLKAFCGARGEEVQA